MLLLCCAVALPSYPDLTLPCLALLGRSNIEMLRILPYLTLLYQTV